jgi:GT2 family glycosyltransferase
VIPIFNALSDVRVCIDSVLRVTDLDAHTVLLVNDGSDTHTTAVLRALAEENRSIQLLENDRNIGVVRSCNRALLEVKSEYALLLNSDVCVTPRWLDKLIACMVSDHSIALASPLANFASHLSVPMIPGFDYIGMNALVEELWDGSYPDVTTVVGFCLMIHMATLSRIGMFDPVFDWGYGEDTELSMRANYFGFRTVCSTDTFLYHKKGATFGAEARDRFYAKNRAVFNDRWRPLFDRDFAEFTGRDPIERIRRRTAAILPGLESAYSK